MRLRAFFGSALILAILMPSFVVRPTSAEVVRSSERIENPAPAALPPEPFVIDTADPSPAKPSAAFSAIKNIFTTPKRPEGLDIAKMPTFKERLFSYLGSFALFAGMAKPTSVAPAPLPLPGNVEFDYDGDNAADIGRWHPSTGEFKVKLSYGGYSTYNLGTTSGKAAPADMTADGLPEAMVFHDGTWTYKSAPGDAVTTYSWGTDDDMPVPGHYEGLSTANYAVFRPSNSTWYIKNVGSGSTSKVWGTLGDIPAHGDYDGDGMTDIAVFRPSDGHWYVDGTKMGYYALHWGSSVDIPVPADYDGDGYTDPAVYRPTTGEWFAYKSSTGNGEYLSATWGAYGDQPVAADYNGDGEADFAVWRPTNGRWYIMNSGGGYSFDALGVPGDQAVPSAFYKQVGSTVATDLVAKERLAPKNATGGTNLYSENFGWSAGLVGLPGRSGLDMGFGMSYNSLIWLKVGNAMIFDPDQSNISPGFRFGFPSIEPVYYDDDKDVWAYMMVTPSGARTEFRQTGVSNVYETADSSYTRLVTLGATSPNDPVEDISINVTNNGSQMFYEWIAGAFRCIQIKDRNGNLISITYTNFGGLNTITDTLGRVVTVNYASGEQPSSITQTWKDNNGNGTNTTYTWATFTYTTIQIDTNFGSPITDVFGPMDGTYLSVLDKVTRSDGSHTDFSYNSYGQVWKITNVAADSTSHVLNYVRTNLESPSSGQPDCPRFTKTYTKVENFNSGNEIEYRNEKTAAQSYSLPGSISGTATRIQAWMVGHPDNLRSNTFVAESGWKEGLPVATEDCLTTSATCSTRKRWTWMDWTQDNTSATYPINPRTIESQVGDATNIKKSETEYFLYPSTNVSKFGRVKETRVLDGSDNVLKKAVNTYNDNSAYFDRRMFQIPLSTLVYGLATGGSGLDLVSKTTYGFDEDDFNTSGLDQSVSPVQHDSTNFSSSFITGRGNLTSVIRWDVTDPDEVTKKVTSSTKYNTAGSVVSKTDPMSRTIKIGYNESIMYNDGVTNRATYAYPTTFTDPADNSSTIKYRFDTGANVEAISPAPAGNTNGKTTKRFYDGHGRLERNSVYVDSTEKSYVRYDYQLNGIQSKVYAPIIDADGDGNLAEDEVLTESWSDGAGRILRTRAPHPNSTGGWSATVTEYDILGRVKKTSVPTEVSVSGSTWTAAGDDATRGWIWTQQEYDWKNRVTRIIPSDSDGNDGKDQIFSYDGCGCAGGEITTIKSEVVPIPDTSNSGRRTQRSYADILGRTYKTEVYDWYDALYNTTIQSFDGADRVTKTAQYAGNTSAAHQDVTMLYDGHGRLKERHYPIEDTATATTWNYNADDSISQVIDPRLAITDYTYDSLGRVTDIDYTPPANYPPVNSPAYMEIPDAPSVEYTYDDLGNRTSMIDGLGSVTYEYDPLSRLTAETRYFTDELADAPEYNSQEAFRLEYTYNLSGGLKTIKDPYDYDLTYTHDAAGRLTTVAGEAFADNTTGEYVEGIQYRAFGSTKQMTYNTDDEALVKMEYDDRLRVSAYEVETDVVNAGFMKKATFAYNNDSKLQSTTDLANAHFSQTNKYDLMGRLVYNKMYSWPYTPYTQTLEYDKYSNLIERDGAYWGNGIGFTSTYSNGRESSTGVTGTAYDAAGNQINTGSRAGNFNQTRTYDAAGRNAVFTSKYKVQTGATSTITKTKYYMQGFDGDGREVKRSEKIDNTLQPALTKYKIWSTALGAYVASVKYTGKKEESNIYAGGAVVATHNVSPDPMYSYVSWRHVNPATGSTTHTNKDGTLWYFMEYEPLGQEINPFGDQEEFPNSPIQNDSMNDAFDPQWQCDISAAISGDDIWSMPDHCRKAAMAQFDRIVVTWNEKNDQTKIDEKASAIVNKFNYSESDNVLAYAATATSKEEEDDKKGENEGCTQDPNTNEWICTVQSEPAKEEIIEIGPTEPLQTQVSRQPLTCIFNINLKVPKAWRNTDTSTERYDNQLGMKIVDTGHLRTVKDQMRNIFKHAGVHLVFDDPSSANAGKNSSFNLEYVKNFSFFARVFLTVTGKHALGWQQGDRGEVSYSPDKVGLSTSGLSTVGSHEAGHWYLKDFPENDSGGHSGGIMDDSYGPNSSNRFTPTQAGYLQSLCNK